MGEGPAFEGGAGTGFGDESACLTERVGGIEGEDGGGGVGAEGEENVAHAVEGLVDDAVVVAVEGGFGFGVGGAADVHASEGDLAAGDAVSAELLGVAGEGGDGAELVVEGCSGRGELDGEGEGEVHPPERGGALGDELDQLGEDGGSFGGSGEGGEGADGVEERELAGAEADLGEEQVVAGELGAGEVDAEDGGDGWEHGANDCVGVNGRWWETIVTLVPPTGGMGGIRRGLTRVESVSQGDARARSDPPQPTRPYFQLYLWDGASPRPRGRWGR